MPLQNRVDPFGELIATPRAGMFFGNRGGRFHRDDQTSGSAAGPRGNGSAACCSSRTRITVWRDRYTACSSSTR
jgi:hypothetical protein